MHYRRALIWLSLALSVHVIAGCARAISDPTPVPAEPVEVTVSRELAYAHPIDDVRRAYRDVLESLRVDVDSTGALVATTPPTWSPGLLRVVIGPSDTLTTRVSISWRYGETGADFHHYPYLIPLAANARLDRTLEIILIPQEIHPRSLRRCPPTSTDTAGVEDPRLVGGVASIANRIRYPEDARGKGIQGVVYLGAVIDEAGRVACIEVLSGLPGGFTQAAVSALRTSAFTPARRKGQPIARYVVQPVRFKLID